MLSIYPPLPRSDDAIASRHSQLVAQQLPAWLAQATPAMRQALSASQASAHAAKAALKVHLAELRDVLEFCDEQLRSELKTRHQLDIEPRAHSLVRMIRHAGLGYDHKLPQEHNLLVAAMQNFEHDAPFASGSMLLPGDALIYRTEDGVTTFFQRRDKPELALTAHEFAATCRRLDLGQRYQQHLDSVFKPAGKVAERSESFMANDRATLAVLAHIARLRDDIGQSAYQMLLQLAAQPFGQTPLTWGTQGVRCCALRMLESADFSGGSVFGALLIQRSDGSAGCIVLLPGDPDHPLKQYPSFAEFAKQLAVKLKASAYRKYWRGKVAERVSASFFERLQGRLESTTKDWVQHLNLTRHTVTGDPFVHLHNDRLIKLYEDARTLVVPTADQDAIALERRHQRYLAAGQDLLNFAGLVVPVVGAAMLACAAVQLLREVFVGVDDWRHGDDQGAFTHAMSVAANVATMALFAGAVKTGKTWLAPRTAAVPVGSQLAELKAVTLSDGSHRLWRPDLSAYASPTPLPADLLPESDGLYSDGARDCVVIEERLHEVRFDEDRQRWRITHPNDSTAYEPLIEPAGSGWQLAAEQQPAAPSATLRERIAHEVAQFSAEQQRQALACADIAPASLDTAFASEQKPSALLLDTLRRFELHRQVALDTELEAVQARSAFAERYEAAQFGHDAQTRLLRRDFPSLSVAAAEEALQGIAPAQRQALLTTGRVPLALAERARLYQQAQRLNRALEGLCWVSAQSTDSQTLYQGIKAHLGSEATAASIREHALSHRRQCAELLGQHAPQRGFNAPMRDAHGRIGYALSGRGRAEVAISRRVLVARIQNLYPGTSRQAAMDLLGLYQQAGLSRRDVSLGLDNLTHERAQMFAQLEAWQRAPASTALTARFGVQDVAFYRADVTSRLNIAWRRQLPEETVGQQTRYHLNLTHMPLLDFPAITANLSYVTHLNLTASVLDAQSLTRVLALFPHLRSLTLRSCRLGGVPPAVDALTELRELDLSNTDLHVDQALLDRLGRLPQLVVLSLNGNRLGSIVSTTGFTRLQQLNLAGIDMSGWPHWASRLPALSTLNLYRTRLREIPADVYDELAAGREVDVFMERNALSAETARLLQRPRGLGRRFQFFTHRFSEAPVTRPTHARVDPWLVGAGERERASRIALWRALEDEQGSEPLLQLIEYLRRTPDYLRDPIDVSRRVWEVLSAASGNRELRQRFYTMAANLNTCVDGQRLMFSDMEVQVLQHEALQGVAASQRGQRLYRLARGLFRLERLEGIARRLIASRRSHGVAVDEAEVRMALRTYLANRLALPGQPHTMAYAATAGIGVDSFDAAQLEVERAEADSAFTDFMGDQAFWADYLHEQYAERFEARLQPFADEMTALDEDQEPGSSADYLRRANAIAARRRAAEIALLGELTRLEQVGFDSAVDSGQGPSG
jgi:hypothetical protein